jgi:hypothetical protein
MAGSAWLWLAFAGLGAWHGLNPAMGWLFAVGLGLQERSRKALFAALVPIALGHALAISLTVFVIVLLGITVSAIWLQIGGATILIGLGLWKLIRARHPKWVGMRVGFWDLTGWSWIMATGHGAGLMLVPFLLGARSTFCGRSPGDGAFSPIPAMNGVVVHTLSHLTVAALMAWLVYDFLGLAILRRAWFNVDLVWSLSLVLAGIVLIFVTPGAA